MSYRPSVVLTFAGIDPTGGAGIQADITSQALVGAHCCPVVTSYTSQDTHNAYNIYPVNAQTLENTTRILVRDVRPQAIKIGLLGSSELTSTVASLIRDIRIDCPQLPIIFDPVLAAGGGTNLSSDQLIDVIRQELLPLCTLITPNTHEACRLAENNESALTSARQLSNDFNLAVLLTGTHDDSDTEQVHNRLIHNDQEHTWSWPRLDGEHHGSGCTLASFCAALLAKGYPLTEALEQAQSLTMNCLSGSYPIGHGQLIPLRINRTVK